MHGSAGIILIISRKTVKIASGFSILIRQHYAFFRPRRKHVQSFKKIRIKLYEELRSQGTHRLYTEVEK